MRKYHGEIIPGREGQKIPVEKIHFLIHPGFITFPESEVAGQESQSGWVALETYLAKARSLGPHELIFAYSIEPRANLRRHAKIGQEKMYMEYLRKFKELLGPRLILLSENQNLMDLREPKAFAQAKRLAEARGYTFDEAVFSAGFGESLGVCVEDGGITLNKTGNLKRPTVIETRYTNDPNVSKDQRDRDRERIKAKWKDDADRIVYE